MQQRMIIPFRLAVFLMMFLSLFICSMLSAAIVYAIPIQASGWVEVRCDPIPADFSDTATVILSNTETGEYYTITCHKINDYIARLQLPVGQYQVEQTSTADNFAYEALTATHTFEITSDMPAAQLIALQIIKHDASFIPPVTEAPTALPDDGDIALNDTLPPADADQETQSSRLDQLFTTLDYDVSSEAELSDVQQTEEHQNDSIFQRVIKVLIGTLVFVILVGTLAFFARRHFEQE